MDQELLKFVFPRLRSIKAKSEGTLKELQVKMTIRELIDSQARVRKSFSRRIRGHQVKQEWMGSRAQPLSRVCRPISTEMLLPTEGRDRCSQAPKEGRTII
jgi:hypothetical protein